MFWRKNKKKEPLFCYIRVGFKGVYITRTCYESAHGTYLCFMFSFLVLGTCKIFAFMPELSSVTFFVTVFPVTFFAHRLGFANPKPFLF